MLRLSDRVTGSETHRWMVIGGGGVYDLVAALDSDDEGVRRDARFALVRHGHPATLSVVTALADPSTRMRLEAARTLRGIGDPQAVPALVRTLEDDDFDVRWIAAEALITVAQYAVTPLLQALGEYPPSLGLLDGAHRVLHALDSQGLLPATVQPVLNTLEKADPFVNTPPAARAALSALTCQSGPPSRTTYPWIVRGGGRER